jgi:hypothetical protein
MFTCGHGAGDIFRKVICKVGMLIWHVNVCVMRPCNLVRAFLVPLPSLG